MKGCLSWLWSEAARCSGGVAGDLGRSSRCSTRGSHPAHPTPWAVSSDPEEKGEETCINMFLDFLLLFIGPRTVEDLGSQIELAFSVVLKPPTCRPNVVRSFEVPIGCMIPNAPVATGLAKPIAVICCYAGSLPVCQGQTNSDGLKIRRFRITVKLL